MLVGWLRLVTSHRIVRLSSLTEASMRPSGLNATFSTCSACAVAVARRVCRATSHKISRGHGWCPTGDHYPPDGVELLQRQVGLDERLPRQVGLVVLFGALAGLLLLNGG